MTLQEARRAQGYPDHEILIGNPMKQWKIVGNSVARQVALVLGLKIREACENDENRGIDSVSPVDAPIAPIFPPLIEKRALSVIHPNRASNFSIVIKTLRDPAEKVMQSTPPFTTVLEERSEFVSNDCLTSMQKTRIPNHISNSAIALQQSITTPHRLLSSSANIEASISLPDLNLLASTQVNGAAHDKRLAINISIIHRKRLSSNPGGRLESPTAEELDGSEKENKPQPSKRPRSGEASAKCDDIARIIANKAR
ncbi:DNA methyltransferase Dim-2 [Ascosphaera aggregata]|nr:DNA methyltransferase Dim-2 [Ascosphaera aggregata]